MLLLTHACYVPYPICAKQSSKPLFNLLLRFFCSLHLCTLIVLCFAVLVNEAEPLIRARDVAALKAPALADVNDDIILRLFDLALSCTSMPTSKRPTTLKLVAELEALWMELSGKSTELSKKVDSALRRTNDSSSKSLEEAFDDMSKMLDEA